MTPRSRSICTSLARFIIMSPISPWVDMRIYGTPSFATMRKMAGYLLSSLSVSPLGFVASAPPKAPLMFPSETSLIIAAPNSSTAIRAISGRKVSMLSTASGCCPLTIVRARLILCISSSAVTCAAPGLVEKAPMSIMLPPSATIWLARSAMSRSVCLRLPS